MPARGNPDAAATTATNREGECLRLQTGWGLGPILSMTPEMLIAPLGIALLVALSWALGGLRSAGLQDGTAEHRFREDYPAASFDRVCVSADRHTALLALSGGHVGLVFTSGSKLGTRLLKPGDVRSVVENSNGLRIGLSDLALTRVDVAIGDRDERADWKVRLESLLPAAPVQVAA